MVYVSFYFIHFLLSICTKDNYTKKIVFLLSVFIFSIIFGLRYDIGADFLGYISYYNSENFQWHIGPGYYFSSAFFKYFNLKYYVFNIFIVSFSLYLIYISVKKQNNYALCFFVFLCLYFLGGTLGQIRQTISMSFILLALTGGFNYKLKFLLMCLATSFHFGGLLGFLLLFISDFHVKNWKVTLFFILTIMIFVKGISLNFLTDYIVYIESDKYGGDNNVSLIAILERFLVLLFCFYNLKMQNSLAKFSFIYVLSCFIFVVFFDIEIISQRLSRFYKFFDVIIIPSLFYMLKLPNKNVIVIFAMLTLLIKPIYVVKAKPSQYLPMRFVSL